MPWHETSFEDDNTEAVFLVNASDVYNALNHQAALTNAHTLAMPHPCADTYQHVPGNTKLYNGGECILSQEGPHKESLLPW